MKNDVIIIGAGAAGLMAMTELLQAGYHVCLLEASPVAGGRIVTIHEAGFSGPVETGAEFVHGRLPLTLALLDNAGIVYRPVSGSMISIQNGSWKKDEAHDPHWDAFMHQLSQLKSDITIAAFLDTFFAGEQYAALRASVQRFSEGFDLADIHQASALAALHEWRHEEETQYRLPGGYGQLIDYLLKQCSHERGSIHFNSQVVHIKYSKEGVTVTTRDDRQFNAAALLITVSAGALQSGSFTFTPLLDKSYADAIAQLGFGSVIKIMLQFSTAFWNTYRSDIGFLLSNETIPTWWTQLPIESNLLTGWLGGPPAAAAWTTNDAALLQSSLQSLAAIFNTTTILLQQELLHYKICRWHNHPYAKGGYSYVTVHAAAAKKILAHPAGGVIFFAGEAIHRGQSQGTVEAALQNGQLAAKMIQEKLG